MFPLPPSDASKATPEPAIELFKPAYRGQYALNSNQSAKLINNVEMVDIVEVTEECVKCFLGALPARREGDTSNIGHVTSDISQLLL